MFIPRMRLCQAGLSGRGKVPCWFWQPSVDPERGRPWQAALKGMAGASEQPQHPCPPRWVLRQPARGAFSAQGGERSPTCVEKANRAPSCSHRLLTWRLGVGEN